jgi:hypothetical protein
MGEARESQDCGNAIATMQSHPMSFLRNQRHEGQRKKLLTRISISDRVKNKVVSEMQTVIIKVACCCCR